MPSNRDPPDKKIYRNPSPELKITPSQGEVINKSTFEKSLLAKPLNLGTNIAVSNLKSVIQGKSLENSVFSLKVSDTDIVNKPIGENDGLVSSSIRADKDVMNVSDDPIDKTIESNIVLPPIHSKLPLNRPISSEVSMNEDRKISDLIRELLEIETPLDPPMFNFDISLSSAEEKLDLLRKNDFNWEELLNPKGKKCPTSFGSEFKSPHQLEQLFQRHPRWPMLKNHLIHGVHFPLEHLDDNVRRKDLVASFQRGNHKSAKKEEKFLAKAMSKEVIKGWNIILPEECFEEIPDLILNPMGVASHLGVSAQGTFVEKSRVTHDLSFPGLHSEE